jgi:hypothetical protein
VPPQPNDRELHEQMNSCSCLTLLLACVIYWQAKEISRVLKMGIQEGEDIDISLTCSARLISMLGRRSVA